VKDFLKYILINKILWSLKQLLPLTYRSHYETAGKPVFCVWRQWFGKVFDAEYWYTCGKARE
jgi:hypothetical protein